MADSVLDDIAKLENESANAAAQTLSLRRLLAAFPDLQRHTDRWGGVRYYSRSVNELCSRYELIHGCGCCWDAALLLRPFLKTPDGDVYSDPTEFVVGGGNYDGPADLPLDGWESRLQEAGIPEAIRQAVQEHFDRAAQEYETTLREENPNA